ncbi:MAG: polysaccharide deacetylase family protein [bacterium]
MKREITALAILLVLAGCARSTNDETAHLLKGGQLIERLQYEQAITEYKSAISINPQSAKAYFMLGEIYFHQANLNHFRTQVLKFSTKYKHNPASPRLHDVNFDIVNQTILRQGLDNYLRALLANKNPDKSKIDNSYINYQLGWAYLVLNQHKDARTFFNKASLDKKDRWGASEPLLFINYLEKKGLTKNNVYYSGNPLEKRICLTFDDGPNNKYTPQVLEILKKYDVKATFFMIGENVKRNPNVARRVLHEGHSIGNHTYKHINLYKKRLHADELEREIDSTSEEIERATGTKPVLFRSPYNYLDEQLINILREKGYTIVSWTYAPRDWEDITRNKIAQRTMENVSNGAIFLFHDGGGNRTETVRALPIIIEAFQKQGFVFVDLPELLRIQQK